MEDEIYVSRRRSGVVANPAAYLFITLLCADEAVYSMDARSAGEKEGWTQGKRVDGPSSGCMGRRPVMGLR